MKSSVIQAKIMPLCYVNAAEWGMLKVSAFCKLLWFHKSRKPCKYNMCTVYYNSLKSEPACFRQPEAVLGAWCHAQQKEPIWCVKNKGCGEVTWHSIANATRNTPDSRLTGFSVNYCTFRSPKWGQEPQFEELWSQRCIYIRLGTEAGDWTIAYRDGWGLTRCSN